MSAINFFEQFASININGDQDITTNLAKMSIDEEKSKKLEKKYENTKIQKNSENGKRVKKFIHGNNVVMLSGQYKGYNGFVYEYFPEKLYFAIDEQKYVSAQNYAGKNIGDEIMTEYGGAKILSKLESMYSVYVEGKGEDVKGYEIRLPYHCFDRYVTFFEDGVLQIAKLLSIKNNHYKMAIVDFGDISRKMDKVEMVEYVSKCFVSGNLKFGEKIVKLGIQCNYEFYMVCKHPENKNDKDLYGIFGKLRMYIPEQFLIATKTVLSVNKSFAKIMGKDVTIKSGLYKNKKGELVNIDDAYLSVQIEATNKIMTNHHICLPNGHSVVKKIVPSDVFYMDLQLNNGNYFQVTECYEDSFLGIERDSAHFVEKTISNDDIYTIMPGFVITDKKMSFTEKTEKEFVLEMIDEQDENTGDDDEDEKDDDDYGEQNIEHNDDKQEYEYEQTEGEMKATFRDTERSNFVERSLTKQESDWMKMITKCCEVLGDVRSQYVVLDKVSDTVKIAKAELEKISVTDWCPSDIRYIVAVLVAYEIMKNGGQMTIYDFRRYVQRLYNAGYIKNTMIVNSAFIRYEEMDSNSSWNVIKMSNEDKTSFKNLYKSKKYDNLVKDLMERCHKMLCVWLGPVSFAVDIKQMELIPVTKPHTVKEYPKYFLTTDDIVNNRTADTAKRIIWGPQSQKLVNVWKRSLEDRLQNEKSTKLKEIYHFVRDNIDNAPFVLKDLEKSDDKMDQLKHRELKRTFDTFTEKLKTFVEKDKEERLTKILFNMQDNMWLQERREEISKRRKVEVEV
jgi:hypothetical protein